MRKQGHKFQIAIRLSAARYHSGGGGGVKIMSAAAAWRDRRTGLNQRLFVKIDEYNISSVTIFRLRYQPLISTFAVAVKLIESCLAQFDDAVDKYDEQWEQILEEAKYFAKLHAVESTFKVSVRGNQ